MDPTGMADLGDIQAPACRKLVERAAYFACRTAWYTPLMARLRLASTMLTHRDPAASVASRPPFVTTVVCA